MTPARLPTSTLRALIALVNLALIALIAWTAHLAFFSYDPSRYEVDPPELSRFVPPSGLDDDLAFQQEVYQTITEVYDRPEPEPEQIAADPRPQPQPQRPAAGDPRRLVVEMAMLDPVDPSGSSVLLRAPGGGRGGGGERSVRVGMLLEEYPEFSAFRGVRLKEVTDESVVLVDGNGEEVRLETPRSTEPSP